MTTAYLQKIRQTNPLIHNITNIVVANYVANGLLALGASPIMADAKEEMADMEAVCSALVINIGTLDAEKVKSMLIAGKAANQHGIPVVLDPVGVGATKFRQETVKKLLAEVRFTAIRGNAGEIAQLAGVDWSAKGVDAGEGSSDIAMIARTAAEKYQCIIAVSGAIDYISDGKQVTTIANGTPLFPKITGSGCLLGAVIAAFLAIDKENALQSVVQACVSYAVAGELAAKLVEPAQYGQFYTRLLDSLAVICDETVQQNQKLKML